MSESKKKFSPKKAVAKKAPPKKEAPKKEAPKKTKHTSRALLRAEFIAAVKGSPKDAVALKAQYIKDRKDLRKASKS